MAMTSVRMPDELAEDLDRIASRLKRTKGWIINEALREFLARETLKQRRLEETLEGIAALEAGETVDGDEVLDWLDSWGTEDELPPPKISR